MFGGHIQKELSSKPQSMAGLICYLGGYQRYHPIVPAVAAIVFSPCLVSYTLIVTLAIKHGVLDKNQPPSSSMLLQCLLLGISTKSSTLSWLNEANSSIKSPETC